MSDREPMAQDVARTDYVGWAAAGLVILAIFAVMAGFWFKYHP